jgi:hypothetical protein
MAITTKRKKPAWKVLLYGVAGVGKTSISLASEKYLLLDVEKGSRLLGDIRRIDDEENPLNTLELIKEGLREAYQDPDTQTVVIDSITELNKIFEAEVLKEMKIPSLLHNYGSGYTPFKNKWDAFLKTLDLLVYKANKNVILIGHNETSSEHDAMLGIEVTKEKIHVDKRILKDIVANFDGVFFYGFEKMLDEKRNIAKGTTRRRLITSGNDDLYIAKSRFRNLEKEYFFEPNDNEAQTNFWKGLEYV